MAKEVALPRVTGRTCPQGVCRLANQPRPLQSDNAFCHAVLPTAPGTDTGSEVGSAGKGLCWGWAESEPPAVPPGSIAHPRWDVPA